MRSAGLPVDVRGGAPPTGGAPLIFYLDTTARFARSVTRTSIFLLPLLLCVPRTDVRAGGPANDACTGATSIPTPPFSDTTDTTAATIDPGAPAPSCGNGSTAKSVWYRFTAPGPGTVTVDTLDSSYDTILSVYTGDCGDLVALPDGCNDDDPRDGAQSRVVFSAASATTYLFLVTAYDDDGGELLFHLRFQPAIVCVGDCDGDGMLDESECNVCESISGGQPLSLCPQCDSDGDELVDVTEVNRCRLGIQGCIACPGDCDGSGGVRANDLVTALAIIIDCPCDGGVGGTAAGCAALPASVGACRSGDSDGDACIAPDEILPLISNIYGCTP